MLGASWGYLPGGDVIVPKGMSHMAEQMVKQLPKGSVKVRCLLINVKKWCYFNKGKFVVLE